MNGEEFIHKTNPFLADTDGDGVSDGDEVNGVQIYVDNGYEQTDTHYDYDSETGEQIEVTYTYYVENWVSEWITGDLTVADQGNQTGFEIDLDGDGLSMEEEMSLGTSDAETDSDFDGITDFDEVSVLSPLMDEWGLPGFDPMSQSDGLADWDGDGISNADEFNLHGTNLLFPDTDFDGFADDIELALGSDPTDPLDPEIPEDGTDPADTDPADTDPVDTDPVDTDPVDTDPVDTDPVDTDPVDTDPVDTDPADTDPADTDPLTLIPLTLIPLTLIPLTLIPLTLIPLTLIPLTLIPLTLIPLPPQKPPKLMFG